MANTHDQFLEFDQQISVQPSKLKKLAASRKAIEQKIIEHFRNKPNMPIPKFWIQGSYKMGTMVLDKDSTYDVDLGIYFLVKPPIKAISLQQNVYRAVKDHTISGAEHRLKCIRVNYKGEFHIDLPVYYKGDNDHHPYLATKNGWELSDPRELRDWFESKKDRKGQLIRMTKYFKSWANYRSRKMPSGIAITVWVAQNFQPHPRDDFAFYQTAKKIEGCFGGFLSDTIVVNPATPGDNLIVKLDYNQRKKFKKLFRLLIGDAEQALNHKDKQRACYIWKHQFGERFPSIK